MSAYDPGTWDIFQDIARVNAWLDAANIDTPDDDAQRVMKVSEEIGEFAEALMISNGRLNAAYIGLTGQNPRKGKTHSALDVQYELADIAVTALCAIQHVTRDRRVTAAILASKLQEIITRASIPEISLDPPSIRG